MAGGIFVSYRRDDTRHVAGRLAGDLADKFGAEYIFRDIESIDDGVEFPVVLEKALTSCVVMLVLIGPKWIDIADPQGRRRLDDPKDWIRQEIATALKRGIRVIPIMVEDTPLPSEEALPEDLRKLVQRQGRPLSDQRWRGDLQGLVETLAKMPGLSPVGAPGPREAVPIAAPPAAPPRLSKGVMLGGAALAVLILIIVITMMSGDGGNSAGTAGTDVEGAGADVSLGPDAAQPDAGADVGSAAGVDVGGADVEVSAGPDAAQQDAGADVGSAAGVDVGGADAEVLLGPDATQQDAGSDLGSAEGVDAGGAGADVSAGPDAAQQDAGADLGSAAGVEEE